MTRACILFISLLCMMMLWPQQQLNAQCGPVISTFPYSENFETVPAWTPGGTNSDWAWGTPTHPTISTAGGGTKSWCVGGLTGSGYLGSAQSSLMSPCFDFSTLNYPWVSFKIFWECERQWDGMVFQYSLNGGVTWANVGAFGDPVNCLNENWFNHGNITWLNSLPAGTRHGWSGRIGPTASGCTGGSGSNSWLTAKHCMSNLAGQPSVRFRFLFGSGTTCNSFDGMAVDDIFIGNAQANVANFTYNCVGNTVSFTSTSTPCPNGFAWNFGDPSSGNNTASTANPSHTFTGPGTYNVTLTASGPCNASGTITIPITILSANITPVNVTCNGGNNGSATVNPSGVGPFSYAWLPGGQTTQTITGLAAGVYTVTVNAPNCCPLTASVTITQPTAVTATSAQVNVSCNGGSNGSAVINASGGTPGYTYLWSPSGGTNANASGLSAGVYICLITDAQGCTATRTVTITQPSVLSATTSQVNLSCNGVNNGSATVMPSGGTPGYSYLWMPSGGTGATALGLAAGTYNCTITDNNGCTTISTVVVTQPTAITAVTSQTSAVCNGGTGSASVVASGGAGGYTYSWSPAGGNNATTTALPAGNYIVTITDANGCVRTASVAITQPAALTAAVSTTPETCNGANGSATVNISGGTPAYSYLWSPSGGNAATASNLSAGNYSCTITDANGCTLTQTVTVAASGAPSLTITAVTHVSCSGGTNATITTATSGGAGPYTYSWSPSGGTGSSASSLAAGAYLVTVTDANGCTQMQLVNITEPPALTATATATPVSCSGGSNGIAAIIVSGGIPGYTYSWLPSGGNNSSANTLTASTYTCTATDANGCTLVVPVTITQPPAFTVSASQTDVDCNGGTNGSASVSPSGGTPGYTYSWTPSGGTGSSETNLGAGTYSCTVTDANGCLFIQSFTITEPSALIVNLSSTPTTCGNTIGTLTSNVSGGSGAYSYAWTPGAYTTGSVNNVGAGNYSLTVTDQNGCTISDTVNVNSIASMTATIVASNNINCFGQSDGSIYISQTGGNPGYTYTWLPNVSAADSAVNIPAGNYQVTITDASGCTASIAVVLTEPPVLTVNTTANPATVCAGSTVQLSAVAAGGSPGYSFVWNPGNLPGNTQTLLPNATTDYTVTLTDQQGCTAISQVNVIVNALPVAAFTSDVTSGCASACVNFSDLSSVSAPAMITSWNWDFGDGGLSTEVDPEYCYSTAGNYSVSLTVTTADGCSNLFTVPNYVQIFPVPTAGFTVNQQASMIDPQITFADASQGATTWNWTFGDPANSTSAQQSPSFTYYAPDCYDVLQVVTNTFGCVDSIRQEVCIDPEVTIYVPNSFTPNGDGMNDYFFPQGEGLVNEEYELLVFDRWGNLIFESHDLYTGWDGRVKGSADIAQMDTYAWKLRVKDAKSEMHYRVGSVNLVR